MITNLLSPLTFKESNYYSPFNSYLEKDKLNDLSIDLNDLELDYSTELQNILPPQNEKIINNPLNYYNSYFNYYYLNQKENLKKNNFILDDDEFFNESLNNKNLEINPFLIGFIPNNSWNNKIVTFGEIVLEFFQRKNHSNSRFSHKLFNALKLSTINPIYEKLLGIKWETDQIIKVEKKIFARLLGIKTIDGSLFHQQGNFPSHGFLELNFNDLSKYNIPSNSIDFDNIRLLIHTTGQFQKNCTEKDIENCKWIGNRNKKKII